jgi:hypothetical protein
MASMSALLTLPRRPSSQVMGRVSRAVLGLPPGVGHHGHGVSPTSRTARTPGMVLPLSASKALALAAVHRAGVDRRVSMPGSFRSAP